MSRIHFKKTGIAAGLALAVALLLLAAARAFPVYGKPLAAFAWETTRFAPLAAFLSPDDAALRFTIGNYYYGGGAYDTAKAKKAYEAALALDPRLEGAHYQLARIHFVEGDFKQALEAINEELELHPDFKRSYYVRGLIHGYNGSVKEAEADFKKFLEWKPDSWAALNDLAWIYFQSGKYEEAAETARRGLQFSPASPWLWNSLGVSLLNLGDKEGAREAFERALVAIAPMEEADWGWAYPGNDPSLYGKGFAGMKAAIEKNLGRASLPE